MSIISEQERASIQADPSLMVHLLVAVRREFRLFRIVTGAAFLAFLLIAVWLRWHRVYVAEAAIRPGQMYADYESVIKKPENLLAVARRLDLFRRLGLKDTDDGRVAMVGTLQGTISVGFPRPPLSAQPNQPPPLPSTYKITISYPDRALATQICELIVGQLQRESPEGSQLMAATMSIRNTPNTAYFEKYLFAPRVAKDVARRLEISKTFATESDVEAASWLRRVVVLGDSNLSSPYFTLGSHGQTHEEAITRVKRLFEVLSDWPAERFGELTDTKFLARVKIYPSVDQKYFREFVYSQRCLMPIVEEQRLRDYYAVSSDEFALRYLSDNIRIIQEKTAPVSPTTRDEVDPTKYLFIEAQDYRPEVALKILQSVTTALQSWVKDLPGLIDNVIRFGDRVRFLASLPEAKVNGNVPLSILAELTDPRGAVSLKLLDPPHLVDAPPVKQRLEIVEEPHVASDRVLLDVQEPPNINLVATAAANRGWKIVLLWGGLFGAPFLGLGASWSACWWQGHRDEIIGSSRASLIEHPSLPASSAETGATPLLALRRMAQTWWRSRREVSSPGSSHGESTSMLPATHPPEEPHEIVVD